MIPKVQRGVYSDELNEVLAYLAEDLGPDLAAIQTILLEETGVLRTRHSLRFQVQRLLDCSSEFIQGLIDSDKDDPYNELFWSAAEEEALLCNRGTTRLSEFGFPERSARALNKHLADLSNQDSQGNIKPWTKEEEADFFLALSILGCDLDRPVKSLRAKALGEGAYFDPPITAEEEEVAKRLSAEGYTKAALVTQRVSRGFPKRESGKLEKTFLVSSSPASKKVSLMDSIYATDSEIPWS